MPAISGLTSGGVPADHVDVAMVDIANSYFLRRHQLGDG
jgi:hypothetical protein